MAEELVEAIKSMTDSTPGADRVARCRLKAASGSDLPVHMTFWLCGSVLQDRTQVLKASVCYIYRRCESVWLSIASVCHLSSSSSQCIVLGHIMSLDTGTTSVELLSCWLTRNLKETRWNDAILRYRKVWSTFWRTCLQHWATTVDASAFRNLSPAAPRPRLIHLLTACRWKKIAIKIAENKWDGREVVGGLPRQGRSVMAISSCQSRLPLQRHAPELQWETVEVFGIGSLEHGIHVKSFVIRCVYRLFWRYNVADRCGKINMNI